MMRILVVDDEPSLLLTLTANLELAGFEVREASNAERALAAIAADDFDLVLSDIVMPGMNGVHLHREIRSRRPDLPVVLMTGFALESLVATAVCEGAFAVLPKNGSIDDLVHVLSRAVRLPTVLVVDDVEDCAEAMVSALSACGIRARAATDAESASRRFAVARSTCASSTW